MKYVLRDLLYQVLSYYGQTVMSLPYYCLPLVGEKHQQQYSIKRLVVYMTSTKYNSYALHIFIFIFFKC